MRREHQVLLSSVGSAVRSLREERTFSRRALAQRSGVSERFLAELEGGQANISVARLQDVARALRSCWAEKSSSPADEPSARATSCRRGQEHHRAGAGGATRGGVRRAGCPG